MPNPKLIQRIQKLRTLAERGATEGERNTARLLCKQLMQQHGITENNLAEKQFVKVTINVKNEHGLLVAVQAYRKMFDEPGDGFSIWQSRKTGHYIFQTPKDRSAAFKAFATDHVNNFFAFVQNRMKQLASGYIEANNLYADSQETQYIDPEDMTSEELLAWAIRSAAASAAPKLKTSRNRRITTNKKGTTR